jgi:uncharacterized SAM-binding protein YcdF (DUF218 family)
MSFFFILSKLLYYLAQPLVIVSFLFLILFFLKKGKRRRVLSIISFGLFFFFSNYFIANEVMLRWELTGKMFEQQTPMEMGILLTGVTSVRSSGPTDRVHYYLGADRVLHTAQLFKLGLLKRILISGGDGKLLRGGIPEALQIRKSLLLMGVPDSVIHTDASSDNTYENAFESKRIIDSLGVIPEKCVLITSAFHMRRALACFKKQGLNVDYFTCDFRASKRRFTPDVLVIPKLEAYQFWQILLKEWFGFIAYKFAGYI